MCIWVYKMHVCAFGSIKCICVHLVYKTYEILEKDLHLGRDLNLLSPGFKFSMLWETTPSSMAASQFKYNT